jgi:hypothetical protein
MGLTINQEKTKFTEVSNNKTKKHIIIKAKKKKVKISLLQAVEAHRVARS